MRAVYSAISRGTEALIAAGRVPESEYQRMRAPFMGGSFPFPVKYGYATVGVVEAGPEALVGRNVFALHPHQTKFDLPAEAVVPLPADVPLPRAVLAANVETALNATWDASWDGAPGPSGRIAVVGAGVVGALVGFLCAQIEGAEVTLDRHRSGARGAGAGAGSEVRHARGRAAPIAISSFIPAPRRRGSPRRSTSPPTRRPSSS